MVSRFDFGRFPRHVQLSHHLRVADVGCRIAVALKTPLHRQWFYLFDHFHLVDPAVAGNTTYTASNMDAVVEVNEIGKIVDPFPQHGLVGLEAQPDRFKRGFFGVNHAKVTTGLPDALHEFARGTITAVAIAAGRRWRNRRMAGSFDRVMAVPTIHLQLSRVQFVTERNRLKRAVADIDYLWMSGRKKTRRKVARDGQSGPDHQKSELVDPCGKMKFLHRIALIMTTVGRRLKVF